MQRQNILPVDAPIYMNKTADASIAVDSVTCSRISAMNAQSQKLATIDSQHKNTDGAAAAISLPKQTQRFNNRGQIWGNDKDAIVLWNKATGALWFDYSNWRFTHTFTHTGPRGRINICWDCTVFQQCKIYGRCGGFTLCLRSNSSARPNY